MGGSAHAASTRTNCLDVGAEKDHFKVFFTSQVKVNKESAFSLKTAGHGL